LSKERSGRETFQVFPGEPRMEVFAGRVEIEIPDVAASNKWYGQRIRLSIAIQQVRIERCLLPQYAGGTRIMVTAPAFSPADLEVNVTPVDANLRALVRALDAGTFAEVTAVRDTIVRRLNLGKTVNVELDPWTNILFGLLSIRFPQVFSKLDPEWAEQLSLQARWAFDAHVIRASQLITAAQDQDRQKQAEAIVEAISHFAKAQMAGSPYFLYTNHLFAELATGIKEYLTESSVLIEPQVQRQFDRVYRRWIRELPLQRGSGVTFTWLARDLRVLHEYQELLPNRNPSGRLPKNRTSVLFEGEVGAGQITLLRGGTGVSSRAPIDVAFHHVPVKSAEKMRLGELDDDPNKYRFGGLASSDGFSLAAAFEPARSRNWVTITLSVQAPPEAAVGIGDFVWFNLHPTFSPSKIKVSFRGSRAQLRIQAWGGFTVGVWIPKGDIKLECDLREVDGAPKIITSR